jgi:predicted PolB exonuclease-like 3'-5' exonuclease
MMNTMVFDIETVPDVEGGRRLYDLDGLSDKDVARAMFQKRVQKTGREFLAHHLQRIVAISIVFRHGDQCRVWSLGDEEATEEDILQRFYDGLERYTPTLVSWNGGGFDLPVIHYRTLLHGLAAPRYWEVGEDDRAFRFDNYLNRFQWRHTDLMDVLAGYQMRAAAPLDEIATLMGFPGKMGMSGAKVWDAFLDGDIGGIRHYCETDVLNTWLVYLRFEKMRGRLTASAYEQECELVRNTLITSKKSHLIEFESAWYPSEAE